MIGYVLLFLMQILFSCIVMGALSYYSYGFVSLDVLRYIKFLKVWRTKLSQDYYLLLIVLAGLPASLQTDLQKSSSLFASLP